MSSGKVSVPFFRPVSDPSVFDPSVAFFLSVTASSLGPLSPFLLVFFSFCFFLPFPASAFDTPFISFFPVTFGPVPPFVFLLSSGSSFFLLFFGSVGSFGTFGSDVSFGSFGTVGSVVSLGSFGTVVSLGSFGTVVSFGSFGTVVSFGSFFSLGASFFPSDPFSSTFFSASSSASPVFAIKPFLAPPLG